MNQRIGDTAITDRDTLRVCIRASFRRPNDHGIENEKEGIQAAMAGLRVLLALDFEKLSAANTTSSKKPIDEATDSQNHRDNNKKSLQSPLNSDDLLSSVEWLPHISKMIMDLDTNGDYPSLEIEEYSDGTQLLPVFPIGGPLMDGIARTLPLFSQFTDPPHLIGMEIPLKIFEPRYRELYRDLLHNNNDTHKREFIVPFPHPYEDDRFAAFGSIFEIETVRDVADESNGQFQLLCNHLVTKPVQILEIANPFEFLRPHQTYLRARAKILDNDSSLYSLALKDDLRDDLRPLEELVLTLKERLPALSLTSDNHNSRPIDKLLLDRLLLEAREGHVWTVAHVWLATLQAEILELQMKISSEMDIQNNMVSFPPLPVEYGEEEGLAILESMRRAQEPYIDHLRCLLIEVSTLTPWLLQEKSHKAQCQLMCQRIRERLETNNDAEDS